MFLNNKKKICDFFLSIKDGGSALRIQYVHKLHTYTHMNSTHIISTATRPLPKGNLKVRQKQNQLSYLFLSFLNNSFGRINTTRFIFIICHILMAFVVHTPLEEIVHPKIVCESKAISCNSLVRVRVYARACMCVCLCFFPSSTLRCLQLRF